MFIDCILVLSSINSHELLEVASNDVISGKAETHHVPAHHLHASPKWDSWGDTDVKARPCERTAVDRRHSLLLPISDQCMLRTASCKFYRRIIIIIIILTPHTRVAYFPSRNNYADFRMNETFPTTCSKSQIVTLWRSSPQPLKVCKPFSYSWRIKDQLDVTCYFISLLMYSTCFGY